METTRQRLEASLTGLQAFLEKKLPERHHIHPETARQIAEAVCQDIRKQAGNDHTGLEIRRMMELAKTSVQAQVEQEKEVIRLQNEVRQLIAQSDEIASRWPRKKK
ncbi:hypothetical protein HY572_04470 [Candidatus Micrarchaeota archaeon]|nr:hypothetical protein [Candidatus Micrarchaeota archaeon]